MLAMAGLSRRTSAIWKIFSQPNEEEEMSCKLCGRFTCYFHRWDVGYALSDDLLRAATLARTYLAIPATSVPSEQIFSQAGLILNKKRPALSPEHANHLICLHENARF